MKSLEMQNLFLRLIIVVVPVRQKALLGKMMKLGVINLRPQGKKNIQYCSRYRGKKITKALI